MLLGKTETSSAGEQLARDNLNERQKTKNKNKKSNKSLFVFRVLYAFKNSHIDY